MAYLPVVVLICQLLYLIDVRGLLIAALILVIAVAVTWPIRHKLSPLPPLPSGYAAPMWVLLIAYPIYTVFFVTAAVEIFSR